MTAEAVRLMLSDVSRELLDMAKTAKIRASSGSDYDVGRHFAFGPAQAAFKLRVFRMKERPLVQAFDDIGHRMAHHTFTAVTVADRHLRNPRIQMLCRQERAVAPVTHDHVRRFIHQNKVVILLKFRAEAGRFRAKQDYVHERYLPNARRITPP